MKTVFHPAERMGNRLGEIQNDWIAYVLIEVKRTVIQ
jgi:hypothetical protein